MEKLSLKKLMPVAALGVALLGLSSGTFAAACQQVKGLGCVPVGSDGKIHVDALNAHITKQQAQAAASQNKAKYRQ